jgi:hypothetical protein
MISDQIVTFTFFRHSGFHAKWQAFRRMGKGLETAREAPGLEFAKLLGSGGGEGFGIWPNFGVYALLAAWSGESAARAFFDDHPFFTGWRAASVEYWTVFMRPAIFHGSWDGVAPFRAAEEFQPDRLVGVLTRATIRPAQLWRFWYHVPGVSLSARGREGLIFSIGVGELPLVQQATFSLWRDSHALRAFAYESPRHREMVRKTRSLGWYEEELFARFHPFASEGQWNGKNPLAQPPAAAASPK